MVLSRTPRRHKERLERTLATMGSALSAETVRDTIASFIVAGSNMTVTHNDVADTLTLDSTGGGGGGLTAEEVRDLVATFAVAGTNMTVTYNDGADTLTFASSGSSGSLASLGWINVKDAPYSAVGDNVTDDTAAIQSAIDAAFGTAAAPNGKPNSHLNKVLYFPPGRYITTAPLMLTQVFGGRIIGAGRFVTKIINITGGTDVNAASTVITEGMGYSRIESIVFESGGTNSSCFDLSWSGPSEAPGASLQAITFIDVFFSGGAYGLPIGGGGFQGDTIQLLNCHFQNQTISGLSAWNYNALQIAMFGGQCQNCAIGVDVISGQVNIYSVGFQLNGWSIRLGGGAQMTCVINGCRTEDHNFLNVAVASTVKVEGCGQRTPNLSGDRFLELSYGKVSVDCCWSDNGDIKVHGVGNPFLKLSNYQTGNNGTWLDYSTLAGTGMIEVELVETANEKIIKERYTPNGSQGYFMAPAVGALTTIYGTSSETIISSTAGSGTGVCTWNPGDINPAQVLSGGNLTITHTLGLGGWRPGRATNPASSGDKVFQFTVVSSPVGGNLGNYGIGLANSSQQQENLSYLGQGLDSVGYYGDGSIYVNGVSIGTAEAFAVGAVLTMEIRDIAGARLLFVRKNSGLWNNNASADPTTGVGGFDLIAAGFTVARGVALYPAVVNYVLTESGTANFGATAYSPAASAGFGNF